MSKVNNIWDEEMVRSHPKTAAAEIKCLKEMFNNISLAILDYDDTDTASQSRRAHKRMVDMANGAQSLLRSKTNERY